MILFTTADALGGQACYMLVIYISWFYRLWLFVYSSSSFAIVLFVLICLIFVIVLELNKELSFECWQTPGPGNWV